MPDPEQLAAWYAQHLELPPEAWGACSARRLDPDGTKIELWQP